MPEPMQDTPLEKLAAKLSKSSDYRVLRRISRPLVHSTEPNESARIALIVDTETTGLKPGVDEVIELGYLLFEYKDNEPLSVLKCGSELNEPRNPISAEIQNLTGLSNDILRGKTFNRELIDELISAASIIVAHNAYFDRPMCENIFPAFSKKPWACSLNEIDWTKYGFESRKLKYLLLESGYFFDGHRALDDCVALWKLLTLLSPDDKTFFELLMESARRPSFAISVEAPYDLRSLVRSAGYRWSAFTDQPGGTWRKSVPIESLEAEKKFINSLETRGASHSIVKEDAYSRFRTKTA